MAPEPNIDPNVTNNKIPITNESNSKSASDPNKVLNQTFSECRLKTVENDGMQTPHFFM